MARESALMRIAFTLKWLFEGALRMAGPLFVILATSLITAVIVVHYRAVIPYYAPYSSFTGLIHLAISTFISFNLGYNYYMVIFTPPGYTPEIVRRTLRLESDH